jgi:hypothetical protein
MTKFNRQYQSKLLNPFIFIGFGVIIALAAVILPLLISPGNDESLKWAIARTTLSAITIPIIIVGFYYTTIQFQKTMARPEIKVAFNEKGEQQATINSQGGKLQIKLPNLWLINEGNAIARYFQIDFIIPKDICRRDPTIDIPLRKNNERYIYSYTNNGDYSLWVNRPQDTKLLLSLAFDEKKIIELYNDSFEIEYRVYGDWAETQEGKLKVLINKKEVSHAHS